MRIARTITAACAALLIAGCAGLGSPPQGEIKKSPQLTEGQLQEQFLKKREEGKRLLDAKQYGNSLDAYLEANGIRPNAPEVLLGIGRAYVNLEYYERSKKYFDLYLGVEKDNDPAIYLLIADIYGNRLGYLDIAVKLAGKVIDTKGATAIGTDYLFLANLLAKAGRKDEAIVAYNKAIELATRDKDAKTVQAAKDAIVKLKS